MLPVKPAIMFLLSLLVCIFMFGTWLMSSLNLDYAQSAMAELRQRQITDTFYANLDRINAHHRQMEHNTQGLARMGRLFNSLQDSPGVTEQRLRQSLQQALRDFPDSYGGSVWFADGQSERALYAYRQENRILVEPIPAAEQQLIRQWYEQLVNLKNQPDTLPDPANNWMPAYYKASIDSAVISHVVLILDPQQQPVGLAVTDWRAEDIVRTVSRVEVTPSTFSFLLDTENRNLSSLSEAENVTQAQALINGIVDLNLYEQLKPQAAPQIISTRQLASPMQQLELDLNQRDYALFFSRTQAGMLFGIGVPRAEIDAVLEPMRESNFRIVSITALILLLISALILYLVAGILRQLHNLYTDSLTDLPNRERLLVDLKKRRTAALILLNIDSFKEINDFYGHECGDHVISQLADALDEYLSSESQWQGSRLYRMPADELAIWLPGDHNEASLRPQLNDLLDFISELRITWHDQEVPVNASLGAASSAQRSSEATGEALLPGANIALELARLHKDNYVIYDERHKVRESYEQNLIWASRLKGALETGRIVPFFQPIMDIKTNRIEKFECLVRLLDEQGEPISPSQFLDLAKKVRLYRSITRCMVESSLRQFADLPYTFSLNLSCEDLLDQALSDHIIETVEHNQIGSRVIFEILESEGIENYAAVRQFIDRAKALGCRIAIDDFGTGYSNFEHLLRLDVDLIKIDGSLIQQLDTNPTAMTICKGIVQFAEELHMQTVAEFVHSPAILAKVRELGVTFAQGAAIGMPSASLITRITMPGE
ncbi:diguanylate cyclase (GGDEF) domain-containing protein [Halopseudomonas sabulinigri]|uniref:Diguanylate cyclase (GGDEF) domain-containing protein n=1 Tax=Halopseudomonas sabulinigri TaxID=472181 RepID=A0A1H1PQM2_9GAMM|nr:bifunctional diguanylate cyclase/phosphodiesterase [Halopseudomonas sabulinigri]SDS13059.1 diguanylate cyclase (GGDEF) domain-containing protein [Halopseudomonas sabulinigri]